MQKKFLAVLLALCLVLAFSSMALAVDFTTSVGSAYNTDQPVATGSNAYTVYANTSHVNLRISGVPTGHTVTCSDWAMITQNTDGSYTCDLHDHVIVTITPPAGEGTAVNYNFTVVDVSSVTAEIDAKLYDGNSAASAAYTASDSKFLVPVNLSQVYAKVSVKDTRTNIPIDADDYTVSGAGKPNANGYAAIPVDDFTLTAAVTVKMGSFELASKSFTMLRPTLDTIYFNELPASGTNSGKKTLTAKSGVYTYYTNEQVDEDWNPVYYKINPLCDEATVTVKRDSAPVTPNSSGWYSQSMSQAPYKLAVTISLSDDVYKIYTVYLMDESYKGPQVKAFYATEKDEGKGDQYLTVVDNDSRKLYVFLPKGVSDFYLALDMDPNAKSLTLGGASINEREWNSVTSLSNTTLYVTDSVNQSYDYDVVIYHNADEHKTDASLKSLKVASGTKASTADNVNIGFDPDVLDYAFPVAKNDVYLSLNATANDSSATVFINNKKGGSLTVKDLDTAAETKFEILVVAGDNKTAQTYTVTINGSAGLLATLTVSNLVGLTPAFDPAVNAYTGYTDAKTVSTVITALAKNYNSDYVQISKANYNKYGQVSSYTALTSATRGSASTTAELKTGSNIFRVDVLSSATATSAKASYYLSISVPKADPSCSVSSQKVYVNGKEHTLSAYNIAGNNYLKLRDIAALLDGTVKEMNVGWNASTWTASMAMPGTFVPTGSELTTLTAAKKYDISNQFFTYNTKPVYPLAYNVTDSNGDGYNYVKLRDIASLLNFGVTYSPTTQSIYIDTAAKYVPGL